MHGLVSATTRVLGFKIAAPWFTVSRVATFAGQVWVLLGRKRNDKDDSIGPEMPVLVKLLRKGLR